MGMMKNEHKHACSNIPRSDPQGISRIKDRGLRVCGMYIRRSGHYASAAQAATYIGKRSAIAPFFITNMKVHDEGCLSPFLPALPCLALCPYSVPGLSIYLTQAGSPRAEVFGSPLMSLFHRYPVNQKARIPFLLTTIKMRTYMGKANHCGVRKRKPVP